MKLNQLSTSKLGTSFLREQSLDNSLEDIDKSAKEELDGTDPLEAELDGGEELEAELDIEGDGEEEIDIEQDVSVDAPSPEELQDNKQNQEYDLNHVTSQLNGMVERWFKLAQPMDPSKKEQFLKLGDRLSEIVEVIESEFMNA
jgi:hypothetical protein